MTSWQGLALSLPIPILVNLETTMLPETAQSFLEWQKSLGPHTTWTAKDWDERKARYALLSRKDKYLVKRGGVDSYFVPENAKTDKQTSLPSPSGRYILVMTPYATKAGSGDHTLGEVYRVPVFPETERVKVAEIRRNYGSMWHCWVENHPLTGQDYLLTGEDYQGFTLINLTTGVMTSYIPEAAFEGFGWCPTSAEVLSGFQGKGLALKVEGCYWACPYEYRIYDFSNPDSPDFFEEGLRDLTANISLDCDSSTELIVEGGNLILTEFESRFTPTGEWERELSSKLDKFHAAEHLARKSGIQEDIDRAKTEMQAQYRIYYGEGTAELWEKIPSSRKSYTLGEDGLFNEESEQEWKSERTLQQEADYKAWEAQDAENYEQAKKKDPTYLELKKEFPNDYAARTGRIFQSQVSRWDGDDNSFHFCFRLDALTKGSKDYTATLDWGAERGELQVETWTRNKGHSKTAFPRNIRGFREALAFAREHLSKNTQ